jgi:site-specific DNA recombinase
MHPSRVADQIDRYVVEKLIARVTRADAAELLEDHDWPDLPKLRDRALMLRARLDDAAAAFAEGAISGAQLRTITAKVNAELAEVEAGMVHTNRSLVLADLVRSDDPQAAWDAMTVDRQREVLATLLSVTVLKGRAGGNSRNGPRPLDVSTVDVREII